MSNRRCAAKTCFNTQGCRPNLKFFNFPKDEGICYQWIVNSGREDLLDKPIEQLSKFMLCADHFETHWFLNPKYKTAFIRTGQPIPTIFYNNLADFVPKGLKKSFAEKNRNHADNVNTVNAMQYSVQQNTEELRYILKDGEISDSSQFQLADCDDFTVEFKMDFDPEVEDSSTIKGCHKICRLCACLVYEFKLISLFPVDSSLDLANKINRLLPEKVSEGDGLPEDVCNSCVNKLNECDSAIQSFIEADRKLRSLFKLQSLIPKFDNEEARKNGDDRVHTVPSTVYEDAGLPLGLTEFIAVKDERPSSSLEDNSREHLNEKYSEVYIIKRSNCTSQNAMGENTITEEFGEESLEVLPNQAHEIRLDRLEESCDPSNASTNDLDSNQEHSVQGTADSSLILNTQDDSNTCDVSEDSKSYHCSICKMEFDERNKLLYHEISEHIFEEKNDKNAPGVHKKYKRERVTCRECGEVFNGKKPLRRHIREQHIPAENICEFCGAHYQIKRQLEVHRRLHTGERPFQCETCNISFHFKKELQRHKQSMHNQTKSLTCSVCNKTCSSRNSMWRHEKTHTDERNVLCYLCGKVLSNPQSMRVHMKTHSSDRPCSCPTCGKSFKDNASVSKHMLMHSVSKDFACDICGRAFYSKPLVKQHKLCHLGVKPHKCDICGAAYNRMGNLNQHKKKHNTSTKPIENLSHECVICGKRMRSELTLKYHLGKHTGEKKPFDCEVCGKRFVALDPYRVHMRIHTGERPYQCTTCGKTFRGSFTLKQHSALHRDECPYPCPYCERKFKRLQSLMVHKRTHTGEKPHRCPLCGRAFAQKGDMIKHTKTHDRDRPATANKMKEDSGGVVMEIEQMPDLALSDSEITSEFLIDMPIVEVETEIQPEISADIHSQIPVEINSEIA